MNKKINTRSARSIIKALVDIVKPGTDFYTVEVYRVDLAVWFPKMHFWHGVKDKEMICPWVQNKRLWRRDSARCKMKKEYGPCSPNKDCKTREHFCARFWEECGKETPRGKTTSERCKTCEVPVEQRCKELRADGACGLKVKPAKCTLEGCKIYERELEKYKERESGFGTGLHLFEVKSDGDTYSRLAHQLPAMLPFCDYCWLVIGENKKIPEWVPPWMGLIIAMEDGFKIEQHAERFGQSRDSTGIYWPNRVFTPEGLKILPRLYRKLTIQALFGWKFGDLDESSPILKKALKAFKADYLLCNRTLDEFTEEDMGADQ